MEFVEFTFTTALQIVVSLGIAFVVYFLGKSVGKRDRAQECAEEAESANLGWKTAMMQVERVLDSAVVANANEEGRRLRVVSAEMTLNGPVLEVREGSDTSILRLVVDRFTGRVQEFSVHAPDGIIGLSISQESLQRWFDFVSHYPTGDVPMTLGAFAQAESRRGMGILVERSVQQV